MTALLIIGLICAAVGGAFFWLHLNTPVQTRVPAAPAVLLPVGAACLLIYLGTRIA